MSPSPSGKLLLDNSGLLCPRPLIKFSAPKSLLQALLNNPGKFKINFSRQSLTDGETTCRFVPTIIPNNSVVYRVENDKKRAVVVGAHFASITLDEKAAVSFSRTPVRKEPVEQVITKPVPRLPQTVSLPKDKQKPVVPNFNKPKVTYPLNNLKPNQVPTSTNAPILYKNKPPTPSDSRAPSQLGKRPLPIDHRTAKKADTTTSKRDPSDAPKLSKYPKSIKTIRSQISKLDSSSTPSPTATDSLNNQNINELFKKYNWLHKAITEKKRKIQFYLDTDFNQNTDLDYRLSVQQVKRLTCEKSMLDLQNMVKEYQRLHQIFSVKRNV